MGLIWNIISFANSAKKTVGSVQKARGQAVHAYRAISQFQNKLVQKDYDLAVAGNAEAQYEMGERCFQGLGVAKNELFAVGWYEMAAMQGHAKAQSNLAMMYFLGRGVPADPAEAYKWIYLAARQGNEEALETKMKMRKRLTPDDIAEGERRAAACAFSAT